MNTQFKDPDAALRARERLEKLGGVDLGPFFEYAFEGNPAPDTALTNLERWLKSTSSAEIYLQQIVGLPALGTLLVQLLGSSQPLADSLIQNPELASLVLEPGSRYRKLTVSEIVKEGRQLLASSSSFSHSLDRLRFLRQKWNLLIVLNDLTGVWPQQEVWTALSDLADALIQLSLEAVWQEKGQDCECPLMIVAFGKLAGRELNYSSDVDLVYVVPDEHEEDCRRLCDALTRALSDRMGRGALYRVDLRLRPYGGAGPVVQKMKAVESYYKLYAEPWEVQALVRTRPITGPKDLRDRWEAMRLATCFKPKLSEIALEQMVSMRDRIEDIAQADDLKRGAGGIRDVEFLTQIFQLLHGYQRPEIQTASTIPAIRALDQAGFFEHANAFSLIDGYTFLRRLEHRTQLVGDRQTHQVPASDEAREALARLMERQNWPELKSDLNQHRRTVSTIYRSILKLDKPKTDARAELQRRLGPLGTAGLQWFDVLPESGAFYQALIENESSLDRVRSILTLAPRLVTYFKNSVALTEMLISGEIEEPADHGVRLRNMPVDAPPRQVADAYVRAYTILVSQWVLEAESDLGQALSDLMDELIQHCARRLLAPFDIIGLGSLGSREFGPGSDADLLLLIDRKEMHREAEIQAQNFLALIAELRRLGTPVQVDMRLRPEGGKGLLVRTYEGLRNYDFEGMEMWERFALGNARLVAGNPEALTVVQKSAYGLPLTPERLKDLARMKRRIETERVKPQHVRRNVKIGYGGLNDIEWLVHLLEMRYPTALKSGETTRMDERIRHLGRAGLMNALEVELLLDAHRYLLSMRTRLFLMGQEEDRIPENPDRLARLAHCLGFEDGNAFLAEHEQIIEAVRRLYTETLDRLRA